MTDAPPGVERDYPLARLTTIRTGGHGEFFARAGSLDAARRRCWRGRPSSGHEVGVVGSGSNLLVADEGVRGLVVKLDRDLAQIERDGTQLLCGGGARLPAVAARGRERGPVGHRVRRQHPRHGRRRGADERERLRRRARARARVGRRRDGDRRRAPHAGPARLRLPPLQPRPARGRRARLLPARAQRRPSRSRRRSPRCARSARRRSRRASRRSARRSRTRTTRAPRGAPPASCWRRPAAAGCASAARASPPSTRTSSRTTAARAPPTCSR